MSTALPSSTLNMPSHASRHFSVRTRYYETRSETRDRRACESYRDDSYHSNHGHQASGNSYQGTPSYHGRGNSTSCADCHAPHESSYSHHHTAHPSRDDHRAYPSHRDYEKFSSTDPSKRRYNLFITSGTYPQDCGKDNTSHGNYSRHYAQDSYKSSSKHPYGRYASSFGSSFFSDENENEAHFSDRDQDSKRHLPKPSRPHPSSNMRGPSYTSQTGYAGHHGTLQYCSRGASTSSYSTRNISKSSSTRENKDHSFSYHLSEKMPGTSRRSSHPHHAERDHIHEKPPPRPEDSQKYKVPGKDHGNHETPKLSKSWHTASNSSRRPTGSTRRHEEHLSHYEDRESKPKSRDDGRGDNSSGPKSSKNHDYNDYSSKTKTCKSHRYDDHKLNPKGHHHDFKSKSHHYDDHKSKSKGHHHDSKSKGYDKDCKSKSKSSHHDHHCSNSKPNGHHHHHNDYNSKSSKRESSRSHPNDHKDASLPQKEAPFPDHYATLGIPNQASADEINKAARKMRVQVHPDKAKRPGMSESEIRNIDERAALVGQAADVLEDAQQKSQYDRRRAARGM